MAKLNLSSLTASKMIVHEISHRGLTKSDDCSLFPKPVQDFFVGRTQFALKFAFSVVADTTSSSPVQGLVSDLLAHPKKLIVQPSKDIADHLFTVHRQTHSEGLVCVLRCEIASGPVIAIIKLEKSDGVRAVFDTTAKRFDIDVIDDLLFTKNTNLYKVAFFTLHSGKVVGLLTDNQTSKYAIPANYFLREFLGCKLRDDPEVITKKFFEVALMFINALPNPETQAKYATALNAEMNSAHGTVVPAAFAKDHMVLSDRAPFLAAVDEAGIASKNPFTKDTAQILTKIRRIRFVFEDGSDVSAAPASIENGTVKVEQGDGDKTRLQIEEKLTETRGS